MTVMERAPYPAKINGESRLLFRNHRDRTDYLEAHPETELSLLGLVAIALFHTKSEQDYLAASRIDDKGEEHWIRDYNMPELFTWMGGVALSPERQKMLHHANREGGSFAENYGWFVDVVVEWEPSPQEEETYIEHELQDLDEAYGMPIEFFEGDHN